MIISTDICLETPNHYYVFIYAIHLTLLRLH